MTDNMSEKDAEKNIELTEETNLVELYNMSVNEDMEKIRQASTSTKKWNEGDLCMAPYAEDGRWYHAKIVKLSGKTCRVCYTEYDEEGDVEISDLLSESDVENPDEEEEESEKMDTVIYEKQSVSSSKNTKNDQFPIPSVCPPPPALFEKLSKVSGNEKEALTNMLMSWYMSGYHTGFYEGLKEGRKTQNGVQNNRRGK